MTGGALPVDGGLIVVMTRFNRILEVDRDNLVARAEPGVVTAHFQAAVEQVGLFYPPDPASREFSTLGGKRGGKRGRNPGGEVRRHPRLRSGIGRR